VTIHAVDGLEDSARRQVDRTFASGKNNRREPASNSPLGDGTTDEPRSANDRDGQPGHSGILPEAAVGGSHLPVKRSRQPREPTAMTAPRRAIAPAMINKLVIAPILPQSGQTPIRREGSVNCRGSVHS
jgi:hypothetical protein